MQNRLQHKDQSFLPLRCLLCRWYQFDYHRAHSGGLVLSNSQFPCHFHLQTAFMDINRFLYLSFVEAALQMLNDRAWSNPVTQKLPLENWSQQQVFGDTKKGIFRKI